LAKYTDNCVFRGVLTGLNEAFVIDKETRDLLISKDINSREIIKPFLAGRDVKRYQEPITDKFLIFTRRGIEIEKFPIILEYLTNFKERLMPKPKQFNGNWEGRKEGSYRWYEIQDAVDYHLEFEKSKIIYPNICKKPEFTFDDNQLYTNQKCFIISQDNKYLLGVLNSSVMFFLFKKLLPELRGNFYEPNYAILKDFPIPIPNSEQANQIEEQVNKILALKKEDSQADTSVLEAEIDRMVYELYELTEEEILIVEGK
jgi:hypothetical protein